MRERRGRSGRGGAEPCVNGGPGLGGGTLNAPVEQLVALLVQDDPHLGAPDLLEGVRERVDLLFVQVDDIGVVRARGVVDLARVHTEPAAHGIIEMPA